VNFNASKLEKNLIDYLSPLHTSVHPTSTPTTSSFTKKEESNNYLLLLLLGESSDSAIHIVICMSCPIIEIDKFIYLYNIIYIQNDFLIIKMFN